MPLPQKSQVVVVVMIVSVVVLVVLICTVVSVIICMYIKIRAHYNIYYRYILHST